MIIHYFCYLIIIIALYIFHIMNNTFLPYVTTIFFGVLTIIGILQTVLFRYGVQMEFQKTRYIEDCGVEQVVKINIENSLPIPILFYRVVLYIQHVRSDRKPTKVYYSGMCSAYSDQTISIPVTCKKCEYIKIEMKNFIVYDYLKIIRLSRKNSRKTGIVVMPQKTEKEMLNYIYSEVNKQDLASEVQNLQGDDQSEIFSVREYQNGDKMNNIHWKLSAKNNEIMVKIPSMLIQKNEIILIEFLKYKHKKDSYELFYNLIYGLIQNILGNGSSITVGYFNGELYQELKVESKKEIYDLYEALYKCKPYSEAETVVNYFNQMEKSLNRRLFYVVPYMNESIEKNMININTDGDLYYLVPKKTVENVKPIKYYKK